MGTRRWRAGPAKRPRMRDVSLARRVGGPMAADEHMAEADAKPADAVKGDAKKEEEPADVVTLVRRRDTTPVCLVHPTDWPPSRAAAL